MTENKLNRICFLLGMGRLDLETLKPKPGEKETKATISKPQKRPDLTFPPEFYSEVKKQGCCCEYYGLCENDPQKPDYCPLPRSEVKDNQRRDNEDSDSVRDLNVY